MEEIKNIFDYVSSQETQEGYGAEAVIEAAKIKEVEKQGKIDLKDGQGIKRNIFSRLSRKNIIYLGKMIAETPIEITEAQGILNLPILNTASINEKLKSIPKENRSKISYIHIGKIQIVIKSTYLRGIESPLELVIMDNRIKNTQESIIGIIQGDLGYTTIKFEVALQYGIPLETKNLDNSIGIAFNFKRQDLMEQGDFPFSIMYAVGFALTNSNHSIEFKDNERIQIDDIFEKTSTQKRIIPRKTLPIPRNQFKIQSNRLSLLNRSQSFRTEPKIEIPFVAGRSSFSTSSRNELDENIKTLRNQVSTLQTLAEGINQKL